MNEIEVMFPSRVWFGRFGTWKPVFTGGDEWGQHTIVLSIPYLIGVVVVTRRYCDCEDMAEFVCTFPACRYMAISPGGRCLTHDEKFYAAELADG